MAKKKTLEDKLLFAQQGELDAVLLYNTMAKKVRRKNPELAETFKKVAASEGQHANVCKKLTGKSGLRPSPLKAIAVSSIYKVSPKLAFQLLVDGEFDAARDYMPIVRECPDIRPVMLDEIEHGKIFQECIEKYCK